MLLPCILLLLSLTYGCYKLYLCPVAGSLQPLKISLIQGNIPQYQKWDENFRASILERYETLTKEAAKDKPDLIIWPETSVPGIIGEEPDLLIRVLDLAKTVNTPILVGAVTSKELGVYYNSALLISADGAVTQQYDKLHLVPFGEYVPLEKYFPFLRSMIGVPIGDFTAGGESTVFKSPERFAALICFEDIIPGLSRRFVKGGAQFLVNITNDAWFMESSAPYQHAAASVFRAIENRVPVVRAANTGLSCFIDRSGRIYDKVSDGKKDIFVVGYKTGEIK
jgi:apolipoprotein N-acyltransferase